MPNIEPAAVARWPACCMSILRLNLLIVFTKAPCLRDPLQQTWQEQDAWMDYYRHRLGPQEGYEDHGEEEEEGYDRWATSLMA
jgi:hypothetical protein